MKITTPKLVAKTSYYLLEVEFGGMTYELRTRVHYVNGKTTYFTEQINAPVKWYSIREPKIPDAVLKAAEAEVKKRHRSINC